MYNRLLDTFITVADSGSINKAASVLFTTPTSVMNQLNTLERHLGLRLVNRTNHGVVLTHAGESIYKDAKMIITFSYDALKRARANQETGRIDIRIGTSMLNQCASLTKIWIDINNQTPDLFLNTVPFLDREDSYQYLGTLLGTEMDAIVTVCDSESWLRKYNFFKLGRRRVSCLIPSKDSLSKKELIRLEDLENRIVFFRKPKDNSVLIKIYDYLCVNYPSIRLNMDVDDYAEMFFKAEKKQTIAIGPGFSNDMSLSMVTRPIDWDFTLSLGLLYGKNPSPAIQRLINSLNVYIKDYPIFS